MNFNEHIELFLEAYITSGQRAVLRDALSQFNPNRGSETPDKREIDYSTFYIISNAPYLNQGDILREGRLPDWNDEIGSFDTVYSPSIILSNACDISIENTRAVNEKQCIMAPVLELKAYREQLEKDGHQKAEIDTHFLDIKRQEVSNILYLPPCACFDESIASLDRVYWFPSHEIKGICENIEKHRASTFSLFGYYLMLFKTTFHFARIDSERS